MRKDASRARQKSASPPVPMVRLLLQDIADGIRVLHTRDGVELTEDQILERARNIVAGLLGNYHIRSLDPKEARPKRNVNQIDLLEQLEKRAEERNNGRPGRA